MTMHHSWAMCVGEVVLFWVVSIAACAAFAFVLYSIGQLIKRYAPWLRRWANWFGENVLLWVMLSVVAGWFIYGFIAMVIDCHRRGGLL